MRRGYQGVAVHEEDGRFLGVSAGWDWCAEHEWGISGIQSLCGISTERTGADKHTATVVPEDLHLVGIDQASYIILHRSADRIRAGCNTVKKMDELCGFYDLEEGIGAVFQSAWSSDGFILRFKDAQEKPSLLYSAFQRCDIMIYTSQADGPFGRSPLQIMIRSAVPAHYLAMMESAGQEVAPTV